MTALPPTQTPTPTPTLSSAAAAAAAEPGVDAGRGPRRRPGATLVVGAALVAVVALAALVSLVWTPQDTSRIYPGARLLGPSSTHLMGTDGFGRDVFSGVLAGAQISLVVGVVTVLIATVLGVPVGVAAGMLPGRTDGVLMRAVDVALAFPALLLAIILGAAFGAGTTTAVLALGVGSAPSFARVARSGTRQVMGREFVLAARAAGRRPLEIARRHVLPNITSMLIVQASVAFAIAVLSEAALSYLGLGTKPPTPSWGRMLQDSQSYLYSRPLLALWPGLAVAWTVLGFNLLGDGLRDLLDPRMESTR